MSSTSCILNDLTTVIWWKENKNPNLDNMNIYKKTNIVNLVKR